MSASPFSLTVLEGEGLEFPPWGLPQMCLFLYLFTFPRDVQLFCVYCLRS